MRARWRGDYRDYEEADKAIKRRLFHARARHFMPPPRERGDDDAASS